MKHKQVIVDSQKPQDVEKLRDLEIMTDRGPLPQYDYSCIDNADVRVIFDDHKQALLQYIDKYNHIVGCIAWLTDYDILEALSKKEFVSIIVQKEDFLKPDINSSRKRLHQLYDSLPSSERFRVTGLWPLSYGADPTLEAVRCVGNYKSDKRTGVPRMHHKFLVFTDHLAVDDENLKNTEHIPFWTPKINDCVWTGSYNISRNAEKSWENVVVLESLEIVHAYVKEWAQIVSLSEPLDWETPWSSPEWRKGS